MSKVYRVGGAYCCEHCDTANGDEIRKDENRGWVCRHCDGVLDEMLSIADEPATEDPDEAYCDNCNAYLGTGSNLGKAVGDGQAVRA